MDRKLIAFTWTVTSGGLGCKFERVSFNEKLMMFGKLNVYRGGMTPKRCAAGTATAATEQRAIDLKTSQPC